MTEQSKKSLGCPSAEKTMRSESDDGRRARPLRVLKFVAGFATCGGTEKQVVGLSGKFNEPAFALEFGCLRRGAFASAEPILARHRVKEYPITSFRTLTALKQAFKFARYLQENGIAIVHSYNFYANVFSIPAAKLAGVPCVIAAIRDMGAYMTPTQLRVHKWACGLADRIIVNADAIKDWLVGQGYNAARISVVRNGLELEQYLPRFSAPQINAEFGIPDGAKIVLMVSRINKKKGVEDLLEAARQILSKRRDVWFVIVGEIVISKSDERSASAENYRKSLSDMAMRLGIADRVVFTGVRMDVPAFLAQATVSVLPSLSEGLPNTVIESMAAGVPVVATRVGGTPELIIEGETGLLIPPGDSTALARAVETLLEDPRLAERLGKAAQQRVRRNMSFDAMYRATVDIYQDVLSSEKSENRFKRYRARALRRRVDTEDAENVGNYRSRRSGQNRLIRPVGERGVAIEEITSISGFFALKEEWQALLEASSGNCLFLTWEWLYTWWKHLGGDRRLLILAIRSRKRLIGIAPFMIAPPQWRLGLPFRTVRFMGTGTVGSDYLDVIAQSGYEEEVARRVVRHLTHLKCPLVLEGVKRDGTVTRRLNELLNIRGWSAYEQLTDICPWVRFSGQSWEDHYNALGSTHRRAQRKKRRAAEKTYRIKYRQVETESERTSAFETFLRLHYKRWSGRHGSEALSSRAIVKFHEEISRVALEHQWLRLSTLSFDGESVASIYGFVYKERFYYYQAGFDAEYARYSPGQMCLEESMKAAFGDGVTTYDMLHGYEKYKFLWARESSQLTRYLAYPPTLRGVIGVLLWHVREYTKRLLGKEVKTVHSLREDKHRTNNDIRQQRLSKSIVNRRLIKVSAAAACDWTGLAGFYGRRARNHTAPLILGYHRVVQSFSSAKKRSLPTMLISTSTLEKQIDWLCRRYDVVSLDELHEPAVHYRNRWRPLAAITFDDGYADVYRNAFPLLRRKGVPFAVFVVTDFVNTRRLFVHDELYHLCRRLRPHVVQILENSGCLDDKTINAIPKSADAFGLTRYLLESLTQKQLHDVVTTLQRNGEVPAAIAEELQCMDWDMLVKMRKAGVVIGCHSRSHALLTHENATKIREETEGARTIMEQRLGGQVLHFAYPDGDYDGAVIDAVVKAGYRYGYGACEHLSPDAPSFTMPRRLLWECTTWDVLGNFSPALMNCEMRGIFDRTGRCQRRH